jgi:uncharacterized protein YbjT (DUF2867 family)
MAAQDQIDVVTGAFSYSGAAIAAELRARGHRVRTLTGHPGRAPSDTDIDIRPLDFADPDGLERSLRGASTLYNTYWVRFARGQVSHEKAVANSRVLFDVAARAGIQRIVHVSITHADPASPYPYFRGKAEVEAHLMSLGVPYAIARPAILFGGNGVLVNNIAWLLRRLPVFAIGGRGGYPPSMSRTWRGCARTWRGCARTWAAGMTRSASTRSGRSRCRSGTWSP